MQRLLKGLVAPVVAILIGVCVGCIIVEFSGFSAWDFVRYLVRGSIGSRSAIAATLRWATPLILAGLAVAVGFRAGVFNVGVEGQLYVGAFAATWVGFTFAGHPLLHVTGALTAAALVGMVWAWIPAILKFDFGANEVVSTLMLNYIAQLLTEYLARYHFLALDASAASIATFPIAETARLPKLMPPYTVHAGMIIAVALAILLFVLLTYTRFGYELRVMGLSPRFAEYGGISKAYVGVSAFLIGGAIAGICGGTEILGVQQRFLSRFSPGFGFDGIVVALMAQNNPLGVIFSGLVMGLLRAGALAVERYSDIPRTIIIIVQGIIVLSISVQAISSGAFGCRNTVIEKVRELLGFRCGTRRIKLNRVGGEGDDARWT